MKYQETITGSKQASDRLFDTVLVRKPSKDYPNCHSTQPDHDQIDLTLAKSQHQEYVSILKQEGVEVIELAPLDGHPDSVFLQDPAVLGETVSIIGRFGLDSRIGEESALASELANNQLNTGNARYIKAPGKLEGGDVLITPTTIFIGQTSRTNLHGISQFQNYLEAFDVMPVQTTAFHLLCGCSYIGQNTVVVASRLVDQKHFAKFKVLRVPTEEEYAANMMYLGNRRVLVAAGYPKTLAELSRARYEVVELDNSEFRKGDGGLSCLSSPVYRVF